MDFWVHNKWKKLYGEGWLYEREGNDGIQSNCEDSFKDGFSKSENSRYLKKTVIILWTVMRINFVIQWNEIKICKSCIWLSVDQRYHIEIK